MPEPESPTAVPLLRRLLLGLLLAALGALCLNVLSPFLSPIVWAAILAYVTWPLYRRLQQRLLRFGVLGALLMTTLVIGAVVVPLLWLLVLVQGELFNAYRLLSAYLGQGPHVLPASIRSLPGIGEPLQAFMDRFTGDPTLLMREAFGWLQRWAGELTAVLGDIGRNLARLGLASITLFFFYRDGDTIVTQSAAVMRRFFDRRLDPYVATAGTMMRAVVFGIVITSVVQGVIASIGYLIFGVEAPVLLGALTGMLSVVPMIGTAVVWVPLAVWLLLTVSVWKGVLLLAWGALLVHPADNVLRPILISKATHVPFLLIMFGVIGGLSAFGLVGAFVGPVLLAVALAVWREWAAPGGASADV